MSQPMLAQIWWFSLSGRFDNLPYAYVHCSAAFEHLLEIISNKRIHHECEGRSSNGRHSGYAKF